jgi:hypothetical protein
MRNLLRPIVYFLFRCRVQLRAWAGYEGSRPSFMVIGTQKGGTTSLYEALCAHSAIIPARTKEISFFDRHFDWGLNWYLANFPRISAPGQITGEATPDYMFMPSAPERIASCLGRDLKFIVLLRDPVDRAISHYFHELRLGSETLELAEAFAAEDGRLGERADAPVGPPLEKLTNRFCFGYRARSLYSEQLQLWVNVFGRDAFYIRTSDAFFKDPEAVRDDVLAFLGMKPEPLPKVATQNIGKYKSKVAPEIYDRLSEDLARETERMMEWINH